VNIVLDYIFIFPLQMELKGAAIATVFSPITSILVATLHWHRIDHHLHFNKVSMQIKKLKDIVSLGFSSFFNEFSSAVVMFLFNIVLLRLVGNIAVSAYAIIANINIIVIALFTGLGQGFQPLASKFLGQGNSKELKHVLKLALIAAVFLSLIIFGIGFFFPDGLVAIFNSEQNQEMALIALQGIPLYFMSFLFTGMNFVVIYYLAAINQARSSLILSALRGFILIIPVLLVMALWFNLIGVWLTVIIVEVMTFIFALYILRKSLSRLA
ncbi:MAG: MATE family efflux transporter, partial [Ruoffia tabacinasalis]